MLLRTVSLGLVFGFVACAGAKPAEDPGTGATPKVAPTETPAGKAETNHPATTSPAVVEGADPETPDEIFARVKVDLLACYVQGKKSTPTMSSGKITLNAAVDNSGKATCVVPSDDTGLTQEVEDCMRSRIGRESFKSNGATWATEIPIVANGGSIALGPPASSAPALETVESHGLPDSAQAVVEALLPELHKCVQGGEGSSALRVVHVGARIGKDGRVECALASSSVPIPAKTRECAASVLAAARFPAPRAAVGLISVPVKILARK